MKLRIQAFLRGLINPDSGPEPITEDPPDDWQPEEAKPLPIALCSPYSYPDQWRLELSKPCYCGLPAIWLDFFRDFPSGGIVAVGTCQHHRGVKQWVHVDDGPVRAYWSPCPSCPVVDGHPLCLGHIVVNDNLHTVI